MCRKCAQKEFIVSASPYYTSNKKKYLVQGDIHKCKTMSNIVIPIHNHSKHMKKKTTINFPFAEIPFHMH